MVIAGFPAPSGRTMADKRRWASRHAGDVRRLVMQEPRGHHDMCGAVFTEPTSDAARAGLLFMDNQGYGPMSAHGVMAAVAIALERQLVLPEADGCSVTLDVPGGSITARMDRGSEGTSVSFVNMPSFVFRGGMAVELGSRRVRADIAFGGAFYAIVDAESVGVPLDASHLPELRRLGMDITRAINARYVVAHPTDAEHSGLYGTVFTGPSQSGPADLRVVAVFANGAVDRSASGTAISAVIAVIDAIGLLGDQRIFACEGILGTTLAGRVVRRARLGDYAAVVPELRGTAWITGEHAFVVHPDDPLGGGFQVP
jgi:trans-L-3-hydroxyproline dehydratase